MKNLKKTLAMISAVVMAGSVFAACGGSTTSDSTTTDAAGDTAAADAADTAAADAGDTAAADDSAASDSTGAGSTLTVMTWNTEFIEMCENYYLKDNPLPEGVTWNPVTFGCQGGEVSSYYDNYFASGEDADLYCLEADWAMTYLDNDDVTAPLSTVGIEESELADQYEYTKAIGTSSSGALKGITWQSAPGGFAYRSDLAEKYLDVKSVDDMQAKISDWDGFLATAATLKEAGNVAICPTLGGVWQVFSSSRNEPWVVDNKFVITDEVKEFMDLAKDLVQNQYTLNYDQWTSEWYACGQTDDVFGYFVSTWGIGDAILAAAAGGEGGATWGKWALCEGPQAYYWGGTWLAAYPKTDNADLVADIMRYFCVNADSMKNYALGSGDFLNNKAVMKDIVDSGANSNPNLGGQDQFAIWYKNAENIDLSFMSSYDKDIKGCLATAYKAYANGEQDYDTAINTFKTGVAAAFPTLTIE
ncbi:MAG: carbohydrate ABC transporter substrate-binding protein [Huintestinicola sp.]